MAAPDKVLELVDRFGENIKDTLHSEELDQIEGMLKCCDKLNVAANFVGTDRSSAVDKLRESRVWFDDNCMSYLGGDPYDKFEFVQRLTSSYVTDPKVFSTAQAERGGGMYVFEQISELRTEIETKISELRDAR